MEHISKTVKQTLEDLIASLKRKRERQYQSYKETQLQIEMLQKQLETVEPQHGDQLDIDLAAQEKRVTEDAKKGKK